MFSVNNVQDVKRVLETVLLASPLPLSLAELKRAFEEELHNDLLRRALEDLREDWRDKGVVGREWVESHGGQVVLVALKSGKSTTAIVERILGGARPG